MKKNFDDIVENLGLTSEFNGMIEDLKKEISDNLTKRISFTPIEPAKENNFNFKKKKDRIKFIFNSLGLVISLIFIIVSIILYVNDKYVVLRYNIKNDINTDVVLNDEDFSLNNKSNDIYVASLIDKINIDFLNNVNFNENYTSIKKVIAKVEITDANDDNTVLFSTNDVLLNKEDYIKLSNNKTNISIDYEKYNSMAIKYKKKINMVTNSNLIIEFSNYIKTESGIKKEIKQKVIVPLNVDTVEILEEYEKNIEHVIYDSKGFKNTSIVIFIISLISFIMFCASTILIFQKNKSTLTELEKKYKKIMNNYNSIIIEVENDDFDKKLITISIKYFVDLIDAQQELHVPILCYTDKITGRTWFYMVTDKLLYKYELNKSDEQI